MFYCWVSSGTQWINRQDFCIAHVRRAQWRWNAWISLGEMTRYSWAGSSCISHSVCKALSIETRMFSTAKMMEKVKYGTLRSDVTEHLSMCNNSARKYCSGRNHDLLRCSYKNQRFLSLSRLRKTVSKTSEPQLICTGIWDSCPWPGWPSDVFLWRFS